MKAEFLFTVYNWMQCLQKSCAVRDILYQWNPMKKLKIVHIVKSTFS